MGRRRRPRREYLDLSNALHAELRLKVWETNPLGVAADAEVPPTITDPLRVASWQKAARLRRELARAANERL